MHRHLFVFPLVSAMVLGATLALADIEFEMDKARRGELGAQVSVGDSFFFGRNTKQDYQKAALWYRRAAEQGAVSAQYRLGLMFFEGKGLPQSLVESYGWASLASAQGDARAVRLMDELRARMKKDEFDQAIQVAQQLRSRILD